MKEQCLSSQQLEFLHLNGFPSRATVISFQSVKIGISAGLHPYKGQGDMNFKKKTVLRYFILIYSLIMIEIKIKC